MKNHLSRRTSLIKMVAVVLAALMLATALPISVFATSSDSDEVKDGALLLAMSALDMSTVTYKRDGVNVLRNYASGISKRAEKPNEFYVNGTAVKNGWGAWGVLTDLPLTITDSYTVEYYIKMNGSTALLAGFVENPDWPCAGANLQLRLNGYINTYYKNATDRYTNSVGTRWGEDIAQNVWETQVDSEGYVRFVMTIDQGIMTMTVGNVQLTRSWNMNAPIDVTNPGNALSNFATKTLGFTVGIRHVAEDGGTAPADNDHILDVKNVSIYKGVVNPDKAVTYENEWGEIIGKDIIVGDSLTVDSFPELGTKNPVVWYEKESGETVEAPMTFTEPKTLVAREEFGKEGPLLLALNGLDMNSVSYKRRDVALIRNYASGVSKKGDNLGAFYANNSAVKNSWGAWGVLTDLPLNMETSYTIEYYVKLNTSTAIFAGFADNLDWPRKGANLQIRMNGNNAEVKNFYQEIDVYMNSVGSQYGVGFGQNIWQTQADADGYVRFILTIDQGVMTIKAGNAPAGRSWYVNDIYTGNPNNPAVPLSNFQTKTLGFTVGFVNAGTGSTKPVNDTCVMEVKNISIYEGIVNPDRVPQPAFVIFENEKGGILRKDLVEDHSVTIESFPEIKPSNPSNQIVWIDKETGEIVAAPTAEKPLVLTEATTFVAYERRANDSVVLGVQYSDVVDGKQDVRFIGGVFNTNCAGVGFEVTARYKNESGEIVEMFYRKSGTAVYDSINATENGTMKNATAYDLGAFYIYGFVLEDVPTNLGQIDFEVKSFKEIGKLALRIYGQTMTVSFKDGVIDNTLAPLT